MTTLKAQLMRCGAEAAQDANVQSHGAEREVRCAAGRLLSHKLRPGRRQLRHVAR